MTLTSESGREPELPVGWKWERNLAQGTQGRVVCVRRGDELAVLRVLPAGSAPGESATELAILAQVRHPGLAGLIDHGTFAKSGERFLLRSWIEGRELSTHAREARMRGDAGGEELGRIVAELCPALDHLHKEGFIHADLKATNVIVAEEPPR